MARLGHRDATGKLVHATRLLQDAVVHLAGGTEDHALGLRQPRAIRGAPGEICRDRRLPAGGVLQGELVAGDLPRGQRLVYLQA